MVKLVTDNETTINLDEFARLGAKQMLMQALEHEVSEFIESHQHIVDDNGHRMVVRNGKAQKRSLTLSSGTIDIETPRVNDKREGQIYRSQILPTYLRKSPKIESLIPILYLRGISTIKMKDTVEQFLGQGTMGSSPGTVSKLIKVWERDLEQFKRQKLTKKYVYLWADGVHVKVRLGDDKKVCLLVIIGVDENGKKDLLSVEQGYRESTEGWLASLRNLVSRGLNMPKVAIGDGALGFWSALRELEEFKDTKEQRCWVHKIKNVLSKLPKRVHVEAKALLHEMMKAPDLKSAELAKSDFKKVFESKYPKSFECIEKDWSQLVTFFNFPAEHWVSIRTTNPIESSFATVKLRTKSTRGAGSKKSAATMAFKLLKECEKKWRVIRGWREIEKLLQGLEYKDGVVINRQEQNQEAAAM